MKEKGKTDNAEAKKGASFTKVHNEYSSSGSFTSE